MSASFRQQAREAVRRVRNELAAGDDTRLKYAALELRMDIEAVTYERAQSYRDEIPQSEYRTWQPKKVMQLLLDIEPTADKGASIAFGLEEVPSVAANSMTSLGAEKVFSLQSIKKHYDARGSYLHLPTVREMEEIGEPDLSRLRDRCSAIIALLDGVLSSPVFNINFGTFSAIACMNPDCGAPVRRRLPKGRDVLAANCDECGIGCELTVAADGQCAWRPALEEVPCPGPSCEVDFNVSPGALKPGRRLVCHECESRFVIGLALFSDEPSAVADSRPAAEDEQ
jgi:hypothetical protein